MAKKRRLKVYLESSFVSYFTGRETDDAKIAADQAHTRRWMREQAPLCELRISQFVIDESMKGPRADVARREEFMRGKEFATVDMKRVASLAKDLLKGHALPSKEVMDAFHIATASVAGMDVLLTWNCRHMANPHTLPLTKEIVRKAGFHCPEIMTPKTFLDNIDLEGAHER